MQSYNRQLSRQVFKLPGLPKIKRKFPLEAGATDTPMLMNQALIQGVVINPKGPSGATRLHIVWRRAALATPALQRVAAAEAKHLERTVRRTTRASMRKQIASVLRAALFCARSGKDHSGLLIPQLLQKSRHLTVFVCRRIDDYTKKLFIEEIDK